MPDEMTVPTALEGKLYFHGMVLMSREAGKEKLNVVYALMYSTFASGAVQHVQKVWIALTKVCLIGKVQASTEPDMQCNHAAILVQILSQHSSGFVSLRKQGNTFKECIPPPESFVIDHTTRDWSQEVDDVN